MVLVYLTEPDPPKQEFLFAVVAEHIVALRSDSKGTVITTTSGHEFVARESIPVIELLMSGKYEEAEQLAAEEARYG